MTKIKLVFDMLTAQWYLTLSTQRQSFINLSAQRW